MTCPLHRRIDCTELILRRDTSQQTHDLHAKAPPVHRLENSVRLGLSCLFTRRRRCRGVCGLFLEPGCLELGGQVCLLFLLIRDDLLCCGSGAIMRRLCRFEDLSVWRFWRLFPCHLTSVSIAYGFSLSREKLVLCFRQGPQAKQMPDPSEREPSLVGCHISSELGAVQLLVSLMVDHSRRRGELRCDGQSFSGCIWANPPSDRPVIPSGCN